MCFAENNLTNPQVKIGETMSKSSVFALAIIKKLPMIYNIRRDHENRKGDRVRNLLDAKKG
jgi:hypothetical protein